MSIKSPEQIINFLKFLRDDIIASFERLEPKNCFQRTLWDHHSGGGGEISLLRGEVFEKAAVNWSGVRGTKLPFQDKPEAFFATGVSLITHMANPHVPTAHMNLRYIETESKFWFGGGYDLTPMGFPYDEDRLHFHRIAKQSLDPFCPLLYDQFSQNAKEYFYIPHRKKERGVGGLFFDHYNSGNFDKDFAMWKAIGSSFLEALIPIYKKRIDSPFTVADRDFQLKMRAHYVEFNLLYDRGTKFGFLSGGNPEAILCSMPPLVQW